MNAYVIVDGSCSGNPGKGGIAVGQVVDGQLIVTSRHIGDTTNNRAEFEAIKLAMELCGKDPNRATKVFTIISDSLLAVNAMNGKNRITNQPLCKLSNEIVDLAYELPKVQLIHISQTLPGIGFNVEEAHALVDKAAKRKSR